MSKHYPKVIFFSLLSIAALVFFSFSDEKITVKNPGLITKYAYELNEAVITLEKVSRQYSYDKVSLDSLQKTVLSTRLHYKKIEFLLAFHYNEYVNSHINGAPLLHLEKEGTGPRVIEPEGLQVLDELVFSEETPEERSQIMVLAGKLKESYNLLYKNLDKKEQPKEMEIAAMRLQLVRIFTLGVTGFDTPGSLNALPEAKASLEGMNGFLKEYYTGADISTITTLFDQSVAYLQKAGSFDAFDRLTFLKSYIDPLYKELGTLQVNADSEFFEQSTSWNPGSNSIFSDDFLNPYYFTQLKREEDSDDLRKLGETLFYDPILSNDQSISCASCHSPQKGFADGTPKSLSNLQGKTVLRNAPTLLNAAYAHRYFYDLRAFTQEQQAEHVIFNPEEFNTAYSAILKKLNEDKAYAKKFKKAYGNGEITREKFSKALASYVLSLTSFNSSFDKYVRNETSELPTDVKNGFNLFMGKASCATCHFAPTFSGLVPPFYTENETEILGVLEDPKAKHPKLDNDEGRYNNQIPTEHAWIYNKSFKTTTVRNAGLTAPYFHNGAYETLEEVIDFYNNGGGGGLGLIVPNQTLSSASLNLTDTEKKELIAFIKSLSDSREAK